MTSNPVVKDGVKVELTEKQRRKLEKDERRKKFADTTIQGTNDYSIVSKRSVEKLYTAVLNAQNGKAPQEYFKHFVKKVPRRSPAINRGYWTRMEAIKQSTHKIIQNSLDQDKRVSIINLGAGYDPLAFQFLDSKNPDNAFHAERVSFIDVDYPDLNKMKVQMINNSKEIREIIGSDIPSTIEGVEIRTKNYTVLSCDLKDIDLFLKQLNGLELNDDNVTKIYIAEVSIAYMAPEFADRVIAATSKLPNSHFLCLEQLLPAGPHQGFGRTMLFHFNKLNSPLKSVSTYPTITQQKLRFEKAGYPLSEGTDLMGFWRSLPKSLHKELDKIEAFDELEEFIHFCQHYIILHATNSTFKLFEEEKKNPEYDQVNLDKTFHLINRTPKLERKFAAAAVSSDGNLILMNGGASISRLDSTLFASNFGKDISINKSGPSARMAHTLDPLEDGKFILIGGRHAPDKPLGNCWILEQAGDELSWKETQSLPSPRFRHSTFKHNEGIVVYGGAPIEPSFLKYNSDSWTALTNGDNISSKSSSAVSYNGEQGVIIGGMGADGQITNTLTVFKINENNVSVTLEFDHPLLSRYGAKCQFISQDEVLVCGGVSDFILFDQTTTFVKVNLTTKQVVRVKIPDNIWQSLPMLVGFDLLKYKDSFIFIGGGEVCYSFGSIWNDILVLGDDKIPTFRSITPLET